MTTISHDSHKAIIDTAQFVLKTLRETYPLYYKPRPGTRQAFVDELWEKLRERISVEIQLHEEQARSAPIPLTIATASASTKTHVMEKVSIAVKELNLRLLEKRNILSGKLGDVLRLRSELERLKETRDTNTRLLESEHQQLVIRHRQIAAQLIQLKRERENRLVRLGEIEMLKKFYRGEILSDLENIDSDSAKKLMKDLEVLEEFICRSYVVGEIITYNNTSHVKSATAIGKN